MRRALAVEGMQTVRTAQLPVATSSRRYGRAPAGFAASLRDLDPDELVS